MSMPEDEEGLTSGFTGFQLGLERSFQLNTLVMHHRQPDRLGFLSRHRRGFVEIKEREVEKPPIICG